MSKLSTQTNNQALSGSPLWVVKIGSSMITDHGAGLDHKRLESWCSDIMALQEQGIQVILVSSGAIAEGCKRLGFQSRPTQSHMQQAAAAVGQAGLVQAYQTIFARSFVNCAQILLTRQELSNRERYLNARTTIQTLLSLGVVPIVNENDTIATDEIRFGDNDTLGALVANLMNADVFVMMTDQQALYTSDPSRNPDAVMVKEVDADEPGLMEMAGSFSSSGLGSGGMYTKVCAAQLAARSGALTYLVSGLEPSVLQRLSKGEAIGTKFIPRQAVLSAKKRWLLGQLKTRGRLVIDDGAMAKILNEGKSLLAVGVVQVGGSFQRGDLVECFSQDGRRLAVGLVNYRQVEAQELKGKSSDRMHELIGYVGEPELIHRDNLVII